LNRSLN